MAKREVKQWITVNGVHVPIYEGQSKDEAVKSYVKDKSGKMSDRLKVANANKKISDDKEISKEERLQKEIGDYVDNELKGLSNPRRINKIANEWNIPKDEAGHYLMEHLNSKKNSSTKSAQIDKDEKTKQEQIKKNEAERKQRNLEQIQTARDNKFAEDIEKARNGDLSARNDYMDRLNAINAKIGSGKGSAKLVEEASQLREKINKINNAYKESDKFKKEDADWKAFQKEQAAKRAEREEKSKSNPAITGSGKEVDKAKAEAIKEAYEKQKSNKGTTYEVMEKDGKYVVVGGNNNGRDDPGSWHSKREDRLDRGYKPLPDKDYIEWQKENISIPNKTIDVSKMGSGKEVDKVKEKKANTLSINDSEAKKYGWTEKELKSINSLAGVDGIRVSWGDKGKAIIELPGGSRAAIKVWYDHVEVIGKGLLDRETNYKSVSTAIAAIRRTLNNQKK